MLDLNYQKFLEKDIFGQEHNDRFQKLLMLHNNKMTILNSLKENGGGCYRLL